MDNAADEVELRTMMTIESRTLTLGHSPDPDDAFMFWAMASGALDTAPLHFEHILQDIQTLNERAMRAELDITAISLHAYAFVAQHYAVLPSGASMGDNYGPMIVSPRAMDLETLRTTEIAVPGTMTSAFLGLRLWFARQGVSEFRYRVLPFDEIMPAVLRGDVTCGLLIHEGQLQYADKGLTSIVNLGEWWFQHTNGLPLPLGCNAIKRSLGFELCKHVANLLTRSIRMGLEHRQKALTHSLQWARGLESSVADRFIGMYVNELTLDYGERGRAGIRRFLDESFEAGLLPHRVAIDFIDAPVL